MDWLLFFSVGLTKPTAPCRRELEFLGRVLVVPRAAGQLAFFSFEELCSQPLSAADYLELCENFDTIFIKDIPRLTMTMRSEARRFITMVDNFYDNKMKIVCTAEVEPKDLFNAQAQTSEQSHESRVLVDDLSIEKVSNS